MIVQKKNDLEICGAIRFRRNEADKSLANYPMVEKRTYDDEEDFGYRCGPMRMSFTDYIVGDRSLLYDDWLVTDKNGHTKIYTPEEFEEDFERYGGKRSGLVKKLPERYSAIQFKKESVEQYGLAKYPMVVIRKYSTYPDKDNVIKKIGINTNSMVNNGDTVVVGDTPVKYFYIEKGKAVVHAEDGDVLVKVPWKGTKTVWEKKRFLFIPYERKVTKPVYDFDSPELHASKKVYEVENGEVHFGDWIVTDEEGKSKAYTPGEFEKSFEKVKEKTNC